MARLTAVLGRIWAIVWRVNAFFVVWGVLLAGFLIPFASRLKLLGQVHSLRLQLYVEFAGVLSILVATWLATHFLDHRPFATIGLAPRRLPRHLAVGAIAGMSWIGLSLGVAWLGGWLAYRPGQVLPLATLLGAGLAVVVNVLTQQLILCGYVLQTIRARAGAPLALVLASTMFVGLHAPAFKGAWLPAMNVFLAGFLFCTAYQLSGELWLGIGMHAVWNYTVGPLLGLTVSGSQYLARDWRVVDLAGPGWLTGGAFGVEGGLIVTATTCLMLAVVVVTLRRGSRSATTPQPVLTAH